ncbi:hypothetical protein AWENTII_000141 [Aspergillus wentii]
MLMFVVSNIFGSTIQITTLPLPVLSTLQASGLVFNTIFATLVLGEAFTRYSLIGTILVCIGAILIATFGAIGEPAHTLDQLLDLLQRRPFVLWMIGTAVIALAILLGSRLLKFLSPWSRSKYLHFLGPYAPRLQVVQSRVRLLRGMCFGMVSGILSAHSLLLAKSAVELIVRTIVDRNNQFNRWQSWMILIGMILLALTQLFYLHRGLKLCSTSILYPFVFCIYNIIAILDGLIYFRQASQLTGYHAGLIALGTIILLSGVLCLSWRLEDIDNHAAVTVVGPSQTGLGPGMAIVEEHSHSPSHLDLGDEEAQTGECQPLLQTIPRRKSPHKRSPSLPLFTSFSQNTKSDVDPASIWAELDDSEYEYAHEGSRSSLSLRASLGSFQTRPRSASGTWRGPRHSNTSPIGQRGKIPRRYPPPAQDGRWRQASAATFDSRNAPQKRRTTWAFPTHVDQVTGYGTQDDQYNNSSSGGSQANSQTTRSAGPLAGSRRILTNAWNTSVQYLSQWTGQRSGRRSQDPGHPREEQQQPLLHDHNSEVDEQQRPPQ